MVKSKSTVIPSSIDNISIRRTWWGLQRVNFNWPVATKNRVCLWKDNLKRNVSDKPSLGISMLTSQFSLNNELFVRRVALLCRTHHETIVAVQWLEFLSGVHWKFPLDQFSVISASIFYWISQLVCAKHSVLHINIKDVRQSRPQVAGMEVV